MKRCSCHDVGPAKVTGHNMAVTAENVRGDLEVQTSYEPVRVTGRPGPAPRRGPQRDRHGDGDRRGRRSRSGRPTRTSRWPISRPSVSGRLPQRQRHPAAPRPEARPWTSATSTGRSNSSGRRARRARLEARSKGGSVSWGLADRPDVDETNGVSLVKAFSAEHGGPARLSLHDLRQHPHRRGRP